MTTALVPLIDGFEEIEALSVIDVLRRADLVVTVAGVERMVVTGSHKIAVTAERLLSEVAQREFDVVVLPGGPGTTKLGADSLVRGLVERQARDGKWVAAICAAPSILADLGLLAGKTACCHPSVETKLAGAKVTHTPVAVDGCFITSRGAGTAVLFALAIVEKVIGRAKADQIAAQICLPESVR